MQNKQNDPLSSELQFLIACCRTDPSDDDTKFILSCLNPSSYGDNTNTIHSIQKFTDLASRHRVLPLIYKTLKAIYSTNTITIPSHYHSLVTELKAHYQAIACRNMLMSAELIRMLKLLKENTIEALAFKGPTLSQIAYGDITLRQYDDLDILIKQNDIHKIHTLFEAEGYEEVFIFTDVQAKNWYKQTKDMIFFHPQRNVYIELHWLLLDNDYPIQVDLNNIWKHTQSLDINGQKIQTFSNESLLLYLCIHGSKHLWGRIEWIKDIDLMVRKREIDWEYLDAQVNESGFERMFLLGLHLSNLLFQTPLPSVIHEKIQTQGQLLKLVRYVMRNWKVQQNIFHKSAIMMHLFPSMKTKLLYLYKIIIKPSRSEYACIDLPKGLYWGYYLVRPYLLIKKYLTKN